MNNLEDETCSNEKPYVEQYNDTQGRPIESVEVNEKTTVVYAWFLASLLVLALLAAQ